MLISRKKFAENKLVFILRLKIYPRNVFAIV